MTRPLIFGLTLLLTLPLAAADYEAALSLPKRTENLVHRDRVEPHWLPDGRTLWYRVQTGPGKHEYVRIDAETGERRTGADLAALELPEPEPRKTSGSRIEPRPSTRTGESSGIRLVNRFGADVDLFWIDPKGEHVRYGGVRAGEEREQHTYDGHVWLVATRTGEVLATIEAGPRVQTWIIDGRGAEPAPQRTEQPEAGSRSPDGRWSVVAEKGRLTLHDRTAGTTSPVGADLAEKVPFSDAISWAPDSRAFVAFQAAPVTTRRVTIVESTPRDGGQPRTRSFPYAKPGDPLPRPIPVIVRLDGESPVWQAVATDLLPNPFTQASRLPVRWAPDGRTFFLDYNERGHQLYRIVAVDRETGGTRAVVEETSRTFIDYTQKTWRHWLDDTGELLWMSERDGWCHLWLVDAKTGGVKNRVTTGTWPVREVLHVDAKRREIWFLASGLRPDEDPYHLHLCRVGFDGGGFRQLTEADGHHRRIAFSPDRRFFTASWSRADHAPVHELRRAEDGGLVTVLEKADASALLAAGWTLPERFVAKGRDGRTDIHGILIKPSHFDPAKRYPVVEEIYAGPHSAFVPKEFGRLLRQHQIAELGFIVVQIDGMGTNHRGKAFHDVAWKNLKDAGFPDRIAWMRAAAQSRPWIDLGRVGIYGGSAGGQSAMRALLDHADFYRVAVADCGCHDNRMDKIWWNEQWMGWPVDDSYAKSSNRDDAHRLEGRLLLIVGELDDNVDPASTTQVVAALQEAGKTFDYMPIVGAGHGAAETPFGSRLRMDFLVRHLIGPQP
ncbi:MAG: prolyl oligopeptidase family serine peptidase [Verrucomicrobiales bacterium]|nr:prolyl oligopeptidase family serine peptidase [Verrucomicrobiales bacterium]